MFRDKKRLARLLLTCLTVFTLAFIWGNSLMDRQASTELSTGLLDFLRPLLQFLGLDSGSDRWLRKLAHFCEFALLGGELCGLAMLKDCGCARAVRAVPSCAATALFVAVLDETIQYFTGRHPSFLDVMLDFSGSICGIVVIYFASAWWSKKHISR